MRLEQHFREVGSQEPLVIEIPKGSYVPVFRERASEPADGSSPTAHDHDAPTRRWSARLPWLLAAALAVACLLLAVFVWMTRPRAGNAAATAPAAAPWLLAAAFDRERVTTVVLPDSGFGLVQGWLDRKLTLDDYLRPGYPASLPGLSAEQVRMANSFAGRPYITFSSAIVTSRLASLAAQHGWRFNLRHARDIKARDLAEGNHILLGSPMSNPWVSLFEKELNFETGWDRKAKVPLFRNRSPRQGEREVYAVAGPNGSPGEAYALVALLLNRPSASGAPSRVLLLEGANMEATEAAWEFAANAPRKALLDDRGAVGPIDGKPYQFEVLLNTRALVGAAAGASVLAVRSGMPEPAPRPRL
jgi:hypothetical protein